MTRALVAILLSGALLATAGCVGDGADPRGTPSPKAAKGVIDAPATLQPLKLSEEPVWSNTDVPGIDVVHHAGFHGDSALVLEGDGVHPEDHFVVVDAATGRVRWDVGGKSGKRLRDGDGASFWQSSHSTPPSMVGEGDDWSVIVEYIQSSQLGLAALSGKDGSVRWKTAPLVDVGGELGPELKVVDVDHEIALVERTSEKGTTTIAIDVSDGRRLWDAPGTRPQGISDGVVLTGGVLRGGIPDGAVVALDAKSGKRLWELSDRYPGSAVVLAAGSATVVKVLGRGSPPGNLKTLVVGTTSGRTRAELKTAGRNCHSDRRTLIACNTTGMDHLVTYQFGDRTAGVSAHQARLHYVDDVWEGRIFTTPPKGERPGEGERGASFDRSGNQIDKDLPGAFVMISDRYAAFYTNPHHPSSGGLVVHRRLT